MLFITEYSVIGSRCTGTYLVNADTKKHAKNIVKKIDEDYCRVKAYTQKELEEEEGINWSDLVDENVPILQNGEVYLIECGT